MRISDTAGRWIVCFLALPALWIAGSVATGVHAVVMIPAAVVIAAVSALTADRSGRGRIVAIGYFLGTGSMMGVAFGLAVAIILTIACGGRGDGSC